MEVLAKTRENSISFHLLFFEPSYGDNYPWVLNHIILVAEDGAHNTLHLIICCVLIFNHGIYNQLVFL